MTNRRPRVTDSDQEIAHWGYCNGYSKYPIALIQLIAVDPSAKDIAEVYYNKPGWPVVRKKIDIA